MCVCYGICPVLTCFYTSFTVSTSPPRWTRCWPGRKNQHLSLTSSLLTSSLLRWRFVNALPNICIAYQISALHWWFIESRWTGLQLAIFCLCDFTVFRKQTSRRCISGLTYVSLTIGWKNWSERWTSLIGGNLSLWLSRLTTPKTASLLDPHIWMLSVLKKTVNFRGLFGDTTASRQNESKSSGNRRWQWRKAHAVNLYIEGFEWRKCPDF